MSRKKKFTVWVDDSPGGLAWRLEREGLSTVHAKTEGDARRRATLILDDEPKKVTKRNQVKKLIAD